MPIHLHDPVILTPDQIQDLIRSRHFWGMLRRRPWTTYAILLIILTLFVVSLGLGVSDDPTILIRMGAKVNLLIDSGETWRLFSPVLLHFGFLHMLFNGWALLELGRMTENVFGRMGFLSIFTLSGLAGVCASAIGTSHLSVGASGAIFGLLGAAVSFGIRHQSEIPLRFRRFFGRALWPWVALNFFLGFMIDGIDNYAHASGFMAGLAFGYIWPPTILVSRRISWVKRLETYGITLFSLAVWGVTGYFLFLNFFDPQPIQVRKHLNRIVLDDLGVTFQVPDIAEEVPNSEIKLGAQFTEPTLGFWLAIQLEPDRFERGPMLDSILAQEIRNESSLLLDPNRPLTCENSAQEGATARDREAPPKGALDNGREDSPKGRLCSFGYRQNETSFLMRMILIPTEKGLVSMMCASPTATEATLALWCRNYFESLTFIRNGEAI